MHAVLMWSQFGIATYSLRCFEECSSYTTVNGIETRRQSFTSLPKNEFLGSNSFISQNFFSRRAKLSIYSTIDSTVMPLQIYCILNWVKVDLETLYAIKKHENTAMNCKTKHVILAYNLRIYFCFTFRI